MRSLSPTNVSIATRFSEHATHSVDNEWAKFNNISILIVKLQFLNHISSEKKGYGALKIRNEDVGNELLRISLPKCFVQQPLDTISLKCLDQI